MNQLLVTLGQDARRFVPDAAVRQQVLPIVIGFSLTAFFGVSQDKEMSPDMYFNSNIRPAIARQISCMNEDLVFDVKRALEAAKACYTVRYRIVNQDPVAYMGGAEYSLFGLAFGMANVLNVSDYEVLAKHNVEVSELYCRTIACIRDMKAKSVLPV